MTKVFKVPPLPGRRPCPAWILAVALAGAGLPALANKDAPAPVGAATGAVARLPEAGASLAEVKGNQPWPGPVARMTFLAGGPSAPSLDSPVGELARFTQVNDIAFVARMPWLDTASYLNQWLVLDGNALRLVSQHGSVKTLAVFGANGHGVAPRFTQMAVRPWNGTEDGDWECFLYNQSDYFIYRLNSHGQLVLHSGSPIRQWYEPGGPAMGVFYRHLQAMAADRSGNLYVAQGPRGREAVIRRIDRSGQGSILVGQEDGPPRSIEGKGSPAALAGCHGLVLDPTEEVLYALDEDCLRVITLATARVATVPMASGLGSPCCLARHGGHLLVGSHKPSAILLLDPATGRAVRFFGNSAGPSGSAANGEDLLFHPGPFYGPADGAMEALAALGDRSPQFAVGRDGRIGVLRDHGIALLSLDRESLGRSLAAPGPDGAGQR